MPDNPYFCSQKNARILMLSQRNLHDHVSRCGGYEFEDVIRQIEAVDVFAPVHSYDFSRGVFRAIKYVTRSSQLANFLKPEPNPLILDRQYDLFFALCASPWDILSLRSIKNWRKNCHKAVCYVDEIWHKDIELWKPILALLKDFDHIFLTYNGSVEEVGQIIQRPCKYLPPAADAILFSPYPDTPQRGIDIYNMGRRSPTTHAALLNYSETNKLFYYYDTPKSFSVLEPREHRSLLANLIKRSRYFLVNKAKVNQPEQISNQREIGNRFFEGAMGGCVLLGEVIPSDVFQQYFDWVDAVISVPFDCPDVADIIRNLDAQPERLAKIGRDNAVNSLLRHDWSHRWQEVLQTIGLDPSPEARLRQAHLKRLAEGASIELATNV